MTPPKGAVIAELEPDDELLLLNDDPLSFSDSDSLDEPELELELLPALAAMSLCDQISSATKVLVPGTWIETVATVPSKRSMLAMRSSLRSWRRR